MRFQWDEGKDHINQQKHGVSFEEAKELFASGVDYLEIYDAAHSLDEDRFIAIGPIERGIVLVIWTERDERDDEVIRILSARWATPRERRLYVKYSKGLPHDSTT